jgi:ABC-2 type transport system permease protein
VSGAVIGYVLLALFAAGGIRGLVLKFRRVRVGGYRGLWFTVGGGLAGALLGQFVIGSGGVSGFRPGAVAGGLVAGAVAAVLLMGWDEWLDHLLPSFYACVRREVRGLFTTPIPYFVLFLFVLISGIYFWGSLVNTNRVGFRDVFMRLAEFGFFLFPLLTMAAFARERAEGTIEVLMTAPVSEGAVTVSKFIGTMVFYLAMLLPTVAYYVVLREIGREIGKPDPGPVYASYLGMVLAGGFFVSLGLFASALTSSQILAAILSWVLMVILWISSGISTVMGFAGSWLGDVLEFLDPLDLHLAPFLRGVIDLRDVVFYLSFTVFFLFLAARSVEARMWR